MAERHNPTLTFHFDEVEKIVRHSRRARNRIAGADLGDDAIIVGDHGVYIMSTAANQPKGKDGRPLIAYAIECNPETQEFGAWWDVKQSTWGGDDGTEFLHLSPMIIAARKLAVTPKVLCASFSERELILSFPTAAQ